MKIKNNILIYKNRILLILSIFLLCLYVFSIYSYAIYDDIIDNNSVYSLIISDARSRWDSEGMILTKSDNETGYYKLYVYDTSKITATFTDNCLKYTCSGFTRLDYLYYTKEGHFISKYNNDTLSSGGQKVYNTTTEDYLYSRLTIYDNNGNVVNPYQPVLFQITQVEQIPEMITKIMKVIIPVGLVVLSVVLLIYLIKSVISHMI